MPEDYGVYAFRLPLTIPQLAKISSAFEPVAVTLKQTAADKSGNMYDVWLILQFGDEQYAVLPRIDDWKTVLKSALNMVYDATRTVTQSDIETAVASASQVEVDKMSGPWADFSAERKLMEACLREVEDLQKYRDRFYLAYEIATMADRSPMTDVIAVGVNDALGVLNEVAKTVISMDDVPADVTGYEAVLVSSGLTEDQVSRLLKLPTTRVVYNTVDYMDKVFGSKPNVVTVTASLIQYNTKLGPVVVSFTDLGGVNVMAVDPDTLPEDITVVAYAVTPSADRYPVLFGCNVNDWPMVWDLVGFGIKNNAPNSYLDDQVANRSLKLHNYCVNVLPLLGWGPLEDEVKNVRLGAQSQ